ncbi:hypothetical protein BELL_0705g00070 [Botrytis elliptica]|uniref:Uncharacterized protein n=1 Tax=Botrytis elliptica TaxID=278938 RepID=A0A4Z1JMM1_9HELO|nr:hypothetical protein EAE99_003111 [Botrytis elliptica]TGO70563.1 hypothetical protein BELL_0705g00070 [Botrytis elliptica]
MVQKLPSWVPDWLVGMEGAPATFLTMHYKFRHTLPEKIFFDGSSMYVHGLILDSIDFATSTMSSETPLPDIKRITLHLSKLADFTNVDCGEPGLAFLYIIKYLGCSTCKNGEPALEALWRTLIGNIANFEPAKPQFMRHFLAVLDTIILRERGIVYPTEAPE